MLKTTGQPSLLVRLGRWMCTCLPRGRLDDRLRDRVRAVSIGRLACWCDRGSAGPR